MPPTILAARDVVGLQSSACSDLGLDACTRPEALPIPEAPPISEDLPIPEVAAFQAIAHLMNLRWATPPEVVAAVKRHVVNAHAREGVYARTHDALRAAERERDEARAELAALRAEGAEGAGELDRPATLDGLRAWARPLPANAHLLRCAFCGSLVPTAPDLPYDACRDCGFNGSNGPRLLARVWAEYDTWTTAWREAYARKE